MIGSWITLIIEPYAEPSLAPFQTVAKQTRGWSQGTHQCDRLT